MRKPKKQPKRGVKGLELWSVSIKDKTETLWITGPLKNVIGKAKKAAKAYFGDPKPRIHRIKSCGTIDA